MEIPSIQPGLLGLSVNLSDEELQRCQRTFRIRIGSGCNRVSGSGFGIWIRTHDQYFSLFKSIFLLFDFVDNTDDISNRGIFRFPANESLRSRVSDPDSLRSLDPVSLFGIREGLNDPLCRNFMFWSAGCFLLRAEGFFCNLNVLYGA